MGRKLAIGLLVLSTFCAALITSVFGRSEPVALDQVLGNSSSDLIELPPSMGGGKRRSYRVAGPYSLVVNRLRVKLLGKGWKEVAVSKAPGHSLFTRGIDEIQVFEGKARHAKNASLTELTRLETREMIWEPHPHWVTVVLDQPSAKPVDRARGLLHDLNTIT